MGEGLLRRSRVGIAGAQGTGKTTLASALAGELEVPLLPESARIIAALGFPLDKETTLESQTAILLNQIDLCHANRETGYVSDRVFFDSVAYMSTIEQTRRSDNHQSYVELVESVTVQMMPDHFDVVLYLPIEFQISDDGFRETDPEFQKLMDTELRRMLSMSKVPVVEVLGSKSERLEQALKAAVENQTI